MDYKASKFTYGMAPTLDGHGRMMVMASVPECGEGDEVATASVLEMSKAGNLCKDVLGRK